MTVTSIRAVIFDFGNVIGFFDHRQGTARMARILGDKLDEEPVYRFYYGTELEDRHERGLISSEEVLQRFKARFGAPHVDERALAQAFGDIFWPNAAVIDVIRRLPGHVRLVLGSNTNELHYRWFAPMFADVFERFAHLVLSFEVGCRKPEPRFYQHCLAACGCPPGEVLFLDDRPENVEAAQALGIRAIRYEPSLDLVALFEEQAGVPLSRVV